MSKHEHHLVVTSAETIPPDVLVEHVAYALRTGFKMSGPFNVQVSNEDGFSQRYIDREGEVR